MKKLVFGITSILIVTTFYAAFNLENSHQSLQKEQLVSHIQTLHSFAAETAMLAEQSRKRHLTSSYVSGQAAMLRDNVSQLPDEITSQPASPSQRQIIIQSLRIADNLLITLTELTTPNLPDKHIADVEAQARYDTTQTNRLLHAL